MSYAKINFKFNAMTRGSIRWRDLWKNCPCQYFVSIALVLWILDFFCIVCGGCKCWGQVMAMCNWLMFHFNFFISCRLKLKVQWQWKHNHFLCMFSMCRDLICELFMCKVFFPFILWNFLCEPFRVQKVYAWFSLASTQNDHFKNNPKLMKTTVH